MKIHGLKEVLNALTIDEKAIGDALQEGGEIILQQAKDNVHDDTGNLRSSVNMIVSKDSDGWIVSVGTNNPVGAYREFGTGGNTVVSDPYTPQYAMEWYVDGSGRSMPHPWLYPAYRQKRIEVVNLIKDSLLK